MERDTRSSASGRPLAVLLGASNLTRGLPAALAATRDHLGGGPIDALVAAGHGRSYGASSRVLVRALPGILDCGLWQQLGAANRSGRRPVVRALLADIGNDIGYGHSPEVIAGWAAECVRRLADQGASGVIVRLPLASLRRLPGWALRLAAAVYFPGGHLAADELLARAERLESLLDEVSARSSWVRAGLGPSWYGPDGIHIWRWKLSAAWRTLLAEGSAPADERRPTTPTLGDRWRLTVALPQRLELLGRRLERKAAGVPLADGSAARMF